MLSQLLTVIKYEATIWTLKKRFMKECRIILDLKTNASKYYDCSTNVYREDVYPDGSDLSEWSTNSKIGSYEVFRSCGLGSSRIIVADSIGCTIFRFKDNRSQSLLFGGFYDVEILDFYGFEDFLRTRDSKNKTKIN